MVYGNAGNANTSNVYITDLLPTNFIPSPSISFPISIGSLPAGGTGMLTITGTIQGMSGDTVINNASIYYMSGGTTGIDSNTGNNSDTGWVTITSNPPVVTT